MLFTTEPCYRPSGSWAMSLEAPRQAAIALLATLIDLVLRDRSLSGPGSAVGVPNALPR